MPKRLTRVLAVVLACLTLAGNVASFSHLALVQHVSCEHGELVDVGRPGASVAAPFDHRAERRTIGGATGAAHGHEHCLLAPTRRNRLGALSQPTGRGHQLAQPVVGHRPQLPFVAPTVPLLANAPKSSPPLG